MAGSTHQRIDTEVLLKAEEMAKKFSISKKLYIEESINFFIKNNISPVDYSPSGEFDLSQLVKKSTDRVISFFRFQEKEILPQMTMEILKTQVAVQALMNLFLDISVPQNEQEEAAKRIENYIQREFQKLESNAHENNQSKS